MQAGGRKPQCKEMLSRCRFEEAACEAMNNCRTECQEGERGWEVEPRHFAEPFEGEIYAINVKWVIRREGCNCSKLKALVRSMPGICTVQSEYEGFGLDARQCIYPAACERPP